ncbi:hypothetical protein DICPUDRAFT_47204 [Dictyostelium purpureum]|uniref:Mitochondrial substrate carrier family protein n=1 Tax=Dictyostelium purpureum TaxID=5786 RepID=F0ZIA1_DICPU|nr:uncharacterized protein DICPUDRAFT_47204 [Dictyostelium purpureum]EGC36321.1 hypothetical protein DICPUDRAFT_47204 [Dictyostelium purpureum]|eukprot:XP_003287136.1 hypothetical protein DICPUDRAFT_47204 [Dictyostelium purpureum]
MSAEKGYKDSIAGTVAGAACLFTGHPFDTIRVRLQTSNTPVGIMECLKNTIKYEGFSGLYKGVTSPLFGMMFETAVLFTCYGQMKELLQKDPNIPLTIPQYAISGGVAGCGASFVLTPVELIKCRLQIQTTGPQKYKGSFDCLVQTLKETGVKGIYRGFSATLAREFVGNIAFFSVYESCKKYFREKQGNDNINLPSLVLSGGLGGMAYWTVLYPVDVAKSYIQVADSNGPTPSVVSILKDIYRREGIKGLFRGYTPTIIRSFPANAAMFSVYEIVIKLLD